MIYEKKVSNKVDKSINETRVFSSSSSGRYEVWKFTVQNFNYKKLFGYGPQGDRFILKNFPEKENFSDNTSNLILYSLVSGGIISIVILFLIFFEIIKIIFINKEKLISSSNDVYLNIAKIYFIFFIIRSIFENSFGLFSIDFLITYLSISYIFYSYKVKRFLK